MPFSAFLKIKEIQSLLRAKQLIFALSRDNITFNSLSICEIETFEIVDLRTENQAIGGILQGFKTSVDIIVPHQSVFNGNDFVEDLNQIASGRWYVQIIDPEKYWQRTTPFPVAISVSEAAFEGTRFSFSLITNDLQWLKHSSPTSPIIVSPTIITTPSFPISLEQTNASKTLTFRLSNPALSPIIETLVRYDLFVYEHPERSGTPIWQQTNLTKSQIIDNDFTQTITALNRGKIYYAIARCKYGIVYADTNFEFVIRFNSPEFIPPTPSDNSSVFFTTVPIVLKTQKTSEDQFANRCEFIIDSENLDTNGLSFYVSNEATFNLFIPSTNPNLYEGTYTIKARSLNSVCFSEFAVRTFVAYVFRQLPTISTFSSTKNKVAVGDPTLVGVQKYTILFSIIQNDIFHGTLTVKLYKNSNLVFQTSMHTSGTVPVSQSFYYTDVTSEGGTFNLEVINLNNQVVSSSLIVQQVSLITSSVYAHFTTRYGLFNNSDSPANTNEKIKKWQSRINSFFVENLDNSTQPTLKSSGDIKYIEFPSALSTLFQPPSQQAFDNDVNLTVYIVASVISEGSSDSTIVTLKQNNITQNTFLGKRLNNTVIRYINNANNDVSTSVSNSSSAGSLRVYGLRLSRSGSSGTFTDFLRLPSSSMQSNSLNINNMRSTSPIGAGRLVINGNLFRVAPDSSGLANVQNFYELIVYDDYHDDVEIQQMCEWLALANNL
jgi:hypothetical protein